jgi:phytoene synthase
MAPIALSDNAALVRRQDPDRFLTALFAPPEPREALLLLYGFNIEIAKTREVVTEPIIGQIRLQWWRDAIEGIYAGKVLPHPLVRGLASAIARHALEAGCFERLIAAREQDLAEEGPADLAGLVDYAEATAGSLALLAAQILGVRDAAADKAGRALGTAWGLVGLLRAVPFHAGQRRLYLPRDLLQAAGAKTGRLFDRGPGAGIEPVVRQVAEEARRHLALARLEGRNLPRAALPVLLLARLADIHLTALARAKYDPFALPRERPALRSALSVAWGALTGRF